MHRRHALGISARRARRRAARTSFGRRRSAPFKIGFILPMTGQSASTGKQIEAAVKLWHGAERRPRSPAARSR